MRATELYAMSAAGAKCDGQFNCHWCAAPCTAMWLHDDQASVPFLRRPRTALQPGSPYVCHGCWLFRRKRTTVVFLDRKFWDGHCPMTHSWWITPDECFAYHPRNAPLLYQRLLKPPPVWALALLEGDCPANLLQFCPVNECAEATVSTPFRFLLNNVVHTYTVYELEEFSRSREVAGLEPGTRALVNLLGDAVPVISPRSEPLPRGRPSNESRVKPADPRRVLRSGV